MDIGFSFDYRGFHVDRYYITTENKREERWAIYQGDGWDMKTIGWESSRYDAMQRIESILANATGCSQ